MEFENQNEQEIDLKDLMFAVLKKWRQMLALAVVLAVVLGGGKAFLTYRTSNNAQTRADQLEAYQQDLELYNTGKETCEREIENINEDIQTQQKYMDESVLMNMSPYDVYEAKADIFIKTDYEIMPGMVFQNTDYTDTILQAYQSALFSAAFQENIAKTVNLDMQYLKELVTITRGSVTMDDAGYTRFTNLLTIRVLYSDENKAKLILSGILSNIDKLHGNIEAAIGAHTVSVVNQTVGSTVDMDLAQKQKDARQQLTDLQQSLSDKEDALKEFKEPVAPLSVKKEVLKTGVKFAVIGAVLGVFAVAFWFAVLFVMSDRVYTAKDIRNRYGLNLLGTICSKEAQKENKLDSLLRRLEGRVSCFDTEQTGSLLAANVENYAGDSRKLLLTGLVSIEQIDQVAELLKKNLTGYELVAGGNMLQQAETLRKLPECDAVVLVEQSGVSAYTQMTQELEKINGVGKTVVGCVVYEN